MKKLTTNLNYDYKFSILVCAYNVENYIEEAIESIISQDIGFKENVQLILVNDGSVDKTGEICERYAQKYPNNIVYKKKKNGGISSAKNVGLKEVKGEIVNFFDSDDILNKNTLSEISKFMDNHPEIDIACIPLVFFEARKGLHPKYKFMGETNRVIDLLEEPYNFILSSASAFYRTSVTKGMKFDINMTGGEDTKFNFELFKKNTKIGYVCEKNVAYNYRKRLTQSSIVDNVGANENGFISLANRILMFDKDNLKNYEIELILYELRAFLKNFKPDIFSKKKNYNFVNKVFNDFIESIDTNYIINESKWVDTIDYRIFLLEKKGHDVLQLIKDDVLDYHVVVHLKRIEIENNKLVIETLFNNFGFEDIDLVAYESNENYIKAVESKELESKYDLTYGINKLDITHYRKFEIDLNKPRKLIFKLRLGDKVIPTKRIHILSNIKLSLPLKSVGIHGNKKIVKVFRDKITISNYKRSYLYYKIASTIKLVFEKHKILPWRLLSKQNKKYILINDRPEKACDNGEAVFKYINEFEKEIAKNTYFVINNNNPDYKRLKKYGKVVKIGSLKHKYLYLNSKMIYTSHTATQFFKAFTKNERYYRDLIEYEYVWLQHGITYNDVSAGANRIHKLYDKIVIATDLEHNEFLKEKYFLKEENILYTGFPRFDYLEDNSENLITIAPTWRRSLTGNILADGSHQTVEDYEESEYHKTFKKLLTSKKVKKLLEKNNYKLNFVLHPGMAGYKELFKELESENIKIVEPQDVIYSEIFSKSKLFITDYSSTFFDFAYLKKPLIYFQFDKEEFFKEHYQQSDFSYEKHGFGEIVYTVSDLEDKIEFYFKNGYKMENKYIKRVNSFFKYNDKNNCKRLVDKTLK